MCALPDRSADAPTCAEYQDANVIREILHTARTIAIVGLSSNVLRPSNFVGYYLQRHGYRVVPVNPNETEVLGEPATPACRDMPFPIDVVDVFRAPARRAGDRRGGGADRREGALAAVRRDQPAGRRDRRGAAACKWSMDRCMKIEHARHMGRMHWLGFNTGVITARRERPSRLTGETAAEVARSTWPTRSS